MKHATNWIGKELGEASSSCSGIIEGDIPKEPQGISAILDPPRDGLGPMVDDMDAAFKRHGVSEMILVGCHTDSWARDLSQLVKMGWSITHLAALDFFP